jgi:hypothetical protein
MNTNTNKVIPLRTLSGILHVFLCVIRKGNDLTLCGFVIKRNQRSEIIAHYIMCKIMNCLHNIYQFLSKEIVFGTISELTKNYMKYRNATHHNKRTS